MGFTITQPKKKDIKPRLLLVFTDSVHFLDNLVRNLGENNFYYLSQKFNFPHDYWDSLKKFKEGLSSKDKFYKQLINIVISDKKYEQYEKNS